MSATDNTSIEKRSAVQTETPTEDLALLVAKASEEIAEAVKLVQTSKPFTKFEFKSSWSICREVVEEYMKSHYEKVAITYIKTIMSIRTKLIPQ